MRIANLDDRLVIVDSGLAIDVETASDGLFLSDPQAIYPRWAEFVAWRGSVTALPDGIPFTTDRLGSPAPRPRQVFAIGLNFDEHAHEAGFTVPEAEPPVFTKFASCLCGPDVEVSLPAGGKTDWEVELVVIIGAEARHVTVEDAWSHVAGLSIGQDISERSLQMAASPPQFGLAKSFPNFGPIGPALVTPEEFADPDDLELGCAIDGERVQSGRTVDLIFPVPVLIAKLSSVLPLLPGDVIFTGTPAGVGMGRDPQRFLTDGEELVSHIGGIGEMRQRFVGPS